MQSETLKKLVEDRVDLKFRIKSEEQSKQLQEFLFEFGVQWRNESTKALKLHHSEEDPYFFYVYKDDGYYMQWGCQEEKFEEDEALEYDLENDCLVMREVPPLWERTSNVIPKDIITIDGIKYKRVEE